MPAEYRNGLEPNHASTDAHCRSGAVKLILSEAGTSVRTRPAPAKQAARSTAQSPFSSSLGSGPIRSTQHEQPWTTVDCTRSTHAARCNRRLCTNAARKLRNAHWQAGKSTARFPGAAARFGQHLTYPPSSATAPTDDRLSPACKPITYTDVHAIYYLKLHM